MDFRRKSTVIDAREFPIVALNINARANQPPPAIAIRTGAAPKVLRALMPRNDQ